MKAEVEDVLKTFDEFHAFVGVDLHIFLATAGGPESSVIFSFCDFRTSIANEACKHGEKKGRLLPLFSSFFHLKC